MATKLRFTQGTSASFLLRFRRPDGEPEDLTEAVHAAFIKRSVFDADADALVDLSARMETYDATAGLALLHFFPADTAGLDSFRAKEWQARTTLADGRTVAHCDHQGPLPFCPLIGPGDIAEPPNDFVEAIVTMSSFIRLLTQITGLTGGQSSDLDGLSTATLAAMPTRYQVELAFDGGIAVRYRLEERDGRTEVAPAAGGFRILCDNDSDRLWNLVLVAKEGVPCVWNPDTVKWHQQLASGTGTGVTPALAQEADAFSLPA